MNSSKILGSIAVIGMVMMAVSTPILLNQPTDFYIDAVFNKYLSFVMIFAVGLGIFASATPFAVRAWFHERQQLLAIEAN